MALILCTGVDPEAMQVRRQFLERAGHQTVTAMNEKELSAACNAQRFDVVILGQTLSPKMKQHVVDLIRQYCPDTKILELYPISAVRTIEDADSWIETTTDPTQELADRVAELSKAA
jgi:CheY-like chemotaxis protein